MRIALLQQINETLKLVTTQLELELNSQTPSWSRIYIFRRALSNATMLFYHACSIKNENAKQKWVLDVNERIKAMVASCTLDEDLFFDEKGEPFIRL